MNLNDKKKIATDAIEKNKNTFIALSDKIWELAELSLKEYKSADEYCTLMDKLGFYVEKNICGIPTAFCGSYGEGKPVIGILGEFDALSGLSQNPESTEKCINEKNPENPNGHGCGHNMLGAASLAAAYGVMQYLKESKKSGKIIFFGTPGEEGGAGKSFMAKAEAWKSLDCALTWHPSDVNQVVTGTCNSCIQTLYNFYGISSHAAGNPQDGRSALDAVELFNTGVQYLREHMKSDARIHYAITDTGGISPNVVQAKASVLYMVRSKLVKDALALQARVDKIAQGAALMSETSYEKIFIDGCSNTVPNHTLEKLLYDNMCEQGADTYTDEEMEFAAKIKATYPESDILPTIAAEYDDEAKKYVDKLTGGGKISLNDFISPLYNGYAFSAGSTDVGDVSWQTPTAQINTVCFVSGAPGHSWQNVSLAKSSIGHKGLIKAAEILAGAMVELFEKPDILASAKEEFESRTSCGYVCPIPDGEYPKAI